MKTIKYPGCMITFLNEHFGYQPLVGAEIGVLKGDHAVELIETLNMELLYLIDPYLPYIDYRDHNRHGVLNALEVARVRMAPYIDRVEWVLLMSHLAVPRITQGLHFVYIDGNHAKKYVQGDLWGYLPLVVNGGVFGGHDYYTPKDPENLCEVEEVVDEFHALSDGTLYLDGTSEYDWCDWWFVKDADLVRNLI